MTALDTAKQPYAGKTVHYSIAGANPQAGTVVLNAAGQAQISYVGHNPGIDTDQLFVNLGGTGVQTVTDPSATALVTFAPLPPAPPALPIRPTASNPPRDPLGCAARHGNWRVAMASRVIGRKEDLACIGRQPAL